MLHLISKGISVVWGDFPAGSFNCQVGFDRIIHMTHLDLREKYFSFFKNPPRNSVVIPSSPLVPLNDPTTLFTGSGMQPLIPYLLGAPHPLGKRLVDVQKSFRGQDIDEVGDNRHDSFFEMMGNWSLGDYFKEEQLAWYFEFLTKVLGIPAEKLHVTCFGGSTEAPKDEESAAIWEKLGIPKERIYFYSVNKNWWSRSGTPAEMPVGEIGGPDSEVFFEFDNVTHRQKFGEKCHPNCDCGKFLEIGNSVFIQYQKQEDGTFKELAQKNVDFGGGLERTLAVLNNNQDIFLTDIYSPIITTLEEISGIKYGDKEESDRSFRIIADHIKAAVFLISEGVIPLNVDRGYILRRLIRRTIRFGRNLSINESFIDKIVGSVLRIYGEVYPELLEKQDFIVAAIVKEESKFQNTLEKGLREFEKLAVKGNLPAEEVFYLYESFGFPYELTAEEAEVKEIKIASKAEYEEAYQRHKEKSRSASQGMFKGGLADHSETVVKYHTATHLLQAALRKILGSGVRQEGSNLTGERLRFDFAHNGKMTAEEIEKTENLVNEMIGRNLQRNVETTTYEQAIKAGAMAFFKEKYPEKVTVYTFIDPKNQEMVSKEICGGPHVETTADMGKFKITKEEAVAGGIRRIYAVLT